MTEYQKVQLAGDSVIAESEVTGKTYTYATARIQGSITGDSTVDIIVPANATIVTIAGHASGLESSTGGYCTIRIADIAGSDASNAFGGAQANPNFTANAITKPFRLAAQLTLSIVLAQGGGNIAVVSAGLTVIYYED